MQVAAVARVPPERLQLIVAPESLAGVGGTSDVPGLGGDGVSCCKSLFVFGGTWVGLRGFCLGLAWVGLDNLHSVVGCDDGVVGVDQSALAGCYCD